MVVIAVSRMIVNSADVYYNVTSVQDFLITRPVLTVKVIS